MGLFSFFGGGNRRSGSGGGGGGGRNWSPKSNHGPLVKSGPTYGQNRSRNSNGQWRQKRSDSK